MSVISGAFRSHKPSGLSSILPRESKVFVSLESLGGGTSGYYGRDQIYFILSKLFAQTQTVRFEIRVQKSPAPSAPPGSSRLATCVATWLFKRQDGAPSSEAQMHFVLSSKEGGWSLVQIREVH